MTSFNEKTSITKEEVLNVLKQNSLTTKIIDVRSMEEYLKNHIDEALHIPLDDLEKKGNIFDKNDYLIITCGKGGGRSMLGADILRSKGHKNVYWLEGGTFGWLEIS